MPIFSGVSISGGFRFEETPAPPPEEKPYIAVGRTGTNRIMTSMDGSSWSAVQAPAQLLWESITYGNGTFVGLANDQNINNPFMYSTDNGATWSSANRPAGADSSFGNRVRFLNNQFIALFEFNNNRICTSPDGINWTAVNTNLLDNGTKDIQYISGTYYALVRNSTFQNVRVLSSSNLTDWTQVALFNTSPTNMSFPHWLEYSNQTLVIAGQGLFAVPQTNASIIYSTDGATYTAATGSIRFLSFSAVYGNDTWVSTSSDQTVLTSSDGQSWTTRDTVLPNFASWSGIVYKNNKFVTVSRGGHVAFSTDGISWTAGTAAEANDWRAIA